MSAWVQCVAAMGLGSAVAVACSPTVIVGDHTCRVSDAGADAALDPDASVGTWSTGFEDGFCDYSPPTGFCYSGGGGSYSLVQSPVHSGAYAAAFTVDGPPGGSQQARCVEEGVFPTAAYYGAWYFVPAPAPQNTGNWNLFHYQGGTGAAQSLHGLWDVSLANASGGGPLSAYLYDFLDGMTASSGTPVPLGQWFHLEVYFKRADDTTGELLLLQDGNVVARLTGAATDDTSWGQWYVGNLANDLSPPMSTVYVDDVTIGSSP